MHTKFYHNRVLIRLIRTVRYIMYWLLDNGAIWQQINIKKIQK